MLCDTFFLINMNYYYLFYLNLSFFSHQSILVICVFILFFISIIFIYYFLGHNSRNAEYVKFLSSVPLQYYKYHGSEQVLSNVQGFYLKLNETWLVSTWSERLNSPYSRYPLPTVAPITLDSLEDCGALTRNSIVISPGLQFELSTCSAWVDFISNPLDLEGVPRGSTIPVGQLLSVLSPL